MKKTRILLLILCFCMILPLIVACGKEETPDVDVKGKYEYDDSSREMAADSIPYGYDLENQTISFFTRADQDKNIWGDSENTDIVYSRIHERNLAVQERLNFKLEFIPSGTSSWQEASEVLKKEIQTMSTAWEAAFTSNNTVIQTKMFNYFHNMNDSEYIDIDERWWYTDATMELSVDNYNYRFLYGDIHISGLGTSSVIYYNKELYSQYLSPTKDPEELYYKVLDGKWTFEEFARLVKNARIERGGDGTNDIYGIVFENKEAHHHFREGVGIKIYERNAQGIPEFNMNNDKTVDFTNAMYEFCYENNGVLIEYPSEYTNAFNNNLAIFELQNLNAVLGDGKREMKSDFGILPYPKWDEAQEEYRTLVHNSSTMVCVPVSTDIDRANEEVSAVIEALASESYRRVAVAYYETALKTAYTRDDLDAQMIDIITGQHDTVKSVLTKNFAYEYSSSLGGIGMMISTLVKNEKSNNFVSKYDSIIGQANAGMKDLIQQYKDGKI
ncbi:MAG: hypothetical protein IJV70_05590 [Clostridia bacterium]|nr:hypothetical protein [Clostridia bacterium]